MDQSLDTKVVWPWRQKSDTPMRMCTFGEGEACRCYERSFGEVAASVSLLSVQSPRTTNGEHTVQHICAYYAPGSLPRTDQWKIERQYLSIQLFRSLELAESFAVRLP